MSKKTYLLVTPTSVKKFPEHQKAFDEAEQLDGPRAVCVVSGRKDEEFLLAGGVNVWTASLFSDEGFQEMESLKRCLQDNGYRYQVI